MTENYRWLVSLIGLLLGYSAVAAGYSAVAAGYSAVAAEPGQLAHIVYFTLADDTPQNRQALVAACQKHLSGHEGTVYFSVGTVADDLNRDVNDKDFDVGLHIVFANREAHDTYQTHARHLRFIEENKSLWSKVRVFDTNLAGGSPIDRFLSATIRFDADPISLADTFALVVRTYNQQHADTAPISIEINKRELQFEGITQNQRVRGIDPKGKTIAQLLTSIVESANPDPRAKSPRDPRQLLVWTVSEDGKSIQITTRRAAEKAKQPLPAVFQPTSNE